MNYRKVKAVVTATLEIKVDVNVEVLIADWPIPVSWDAHVRIMDAAKHRLEQNPPILSMPPIDTAKLSIKSSNMKKWKW
jgi:hypothetical protein